MHTWHWSTWEGLPYLTCSLLQPWQHGFFTNQFWPRPPLELVHILETSATAYRVKQVHGNIVLTPSEIANLINQGGPEVDTEGEIPQAKADGLITEQPLQAVFVASADCTPVLIADRTTGQVSAIHAGWRGTALKIVPQAISRLIQQGSKIEDLLVAMGPAIAGEVYQVSTQVAAEIGASIVSHPTDAEIITHLQSFPNSPVLTDPHPDRVRIDVRRVNALQLEKLGLDAEQIAIAPHCTYQDPENFFSYRRNKLKRIQWSGIVSHSGEKTHP